MPVWTSQDDVIISLDNAADTLVDISGYVNALTLDIAINIGTFSTFGSKFSHKAEGTTDATGTMTLHGDRDTSGARDLLDSWLLHPTNKAGKRSLRVQDPDASVGSHQYDMEIYASGNNVAQKTAGEPTPSQHQLQFSVDGAVTKTIIT